MSTKAIRQTLAALGPRQAVAVGKEPPAKLPSGTVQLTFGKTYALQRQASNIVETLPGKITAAVKALVESGGVVSKKVAKAAGLDFDALVEKLQNNKALSVTAMATKVIVTPKAKRADLISALSAPATPGPAKKAAATKQVASKPAAKAAKSPAKATAKAKAGKATKEAKSGKPAKADKKAANGKKGKETNLPNVKGTKGKKTKPVAKEVSKKAGKGKKR